MTIAKDNYEMFCSLTFQKLFGDSECTDVTLATEDDGQIRAHKIILISCSSLFKRILQKNPHPNPIIYLKDIKLQHLECILKYVYQGKCEIPQEDLYSFLITGKDLQIEGLQEVTETEQSVFVSKNMREGFKLKATKLEKQAETNCLEIAFDRNTESESETNSAEKTHQSELSHFCDQCHFESETKVDLQYHMESHLLQNQFLGLGKMPIFEGRQDILKAKKAIKLLKNPPCWISNVEDFARAKSGTVWLFRTPAMADCEAWRSNGHTFRQQSGQAIRKGKDGVRVEVEDDREDDRRVAWIVTQENKTGDKRFQRISWTLKSNPRDTLVQFVGDDSLSRPLVHGNSKKNLRFPNN